jgi:hypothetical protein
MRKLLRPFLLVAGVLFAGQSAHAQTLTFTVNVIQSTVNIGQTVNWELFVTVSGSTASNFGIAAATANLTESAGVALSAGTIGTPFSDYSFSSGGTGGGGGTLTEIGASLFTQNNATVEARDPANGGTVPGLGPLMLASGSFTAGGPNGLHTLSATAGSLNQFFTATGQFLGGGSQNFALVFQNDTYTVGPAGVPEPASWLLASTLGVPVVVSRLRRRGSRKSTTSA